MLKKRVIASLFIKNGIVVQSKNFNEYLPVGKPEIAAEAFNAWGVDEVFLMDIDSTKENRSINLDIVQKVAAKCLVPLTVGGGVINVDMVGKLLEGGADKVCINNGLGTSIKILEDGRKKFGAQCMIAAIDSTFVSGTYSVYDYRRSKSTKVPISSAIKKYIHAGAGELFLNDVDRDGSYRGYDLKLVQMVADASSVPVICCGGAGTPSDILEVLKNTSVSAAAAGNIFHFNEHSITIVKARVGKEVPLRQDTQFTYSAMPISSTGRVGRLSDCELENLLYEKIKVEKI